jgi:CBS domain-containing protein
MELADLMNTSVLSVTPDTTLAEAAHRMVDHDTGAACVVQGDQLVGVISERDLLRVLAQGFDPDLNVSDRMVDHDTGAACVVEDGKLVGVISERDLLRVLAQGFDPDLKVADRMVGNVLTASAKTSLPEAMAIMVDGHFRHLPVLDHGRVIGMCSMRYLMAWAALRLRHGTGDHEDDPVDTAELVATINRMRTGAN